MRANVVYALTAFACVASLAASAQQGGFKLNEVFRSGKTATVQELQFPTGKVEIVAGVGEFATGSETPMHKHPYPRRLYIVEGTFTVTEEGKPPRTYPAGSFVVEAVDVWHTGGNTSSAPAKILVIDEVPAGMNNLVLKPK
ncbi:cupin domain-containing protein [Azospirillum canadense]|uniref:cupin domain-containing protein n=1 Tax=Azospirillum canadense TaxID=403962 RepID=UPI002226EAB5|nr:cupin domain-containing protein [Azospirillum canadense]MCW2241199.1 quercetin dioxygenase-like cupin family protein [Azospirillum canadense]